MCYQQAYSAHFQSQFDKGSVAEYQSFEKFIATDPMKNMVQVLESTSPLADTQSDVSSDVDSQDPEGLIAAMGYGDP